MVYTEKKIAAILKREGYKLTPQRRSLLNLIARSREHLTPAEIYERLRSECPQIGLVTIYRTLEILTNLGLVCEVRTGGNQRSYLMRRPLEHHHHLVCSGCGAVIDFTGCDLSGIESKLVRETGFSIQSHYLEFTGQCRKCREKGA